MANICTTEITIYHDDKSKLEDFFNKLKSWNISFDNDASDNWLGNFIENSKIGHYKDYYCRGSVCDISLNGNEIHLLEETAWSPAIRMWTDICDKFLPDYELTFSAEELGCGILESNDSNYIGNYYVDVYDEPEDESLKDIESMYLAEEDGVVDILQRILKTQESDIDKLLKQLEESDVDWIAIHQWKESSVDDCD